MEPEYDIRRTVNIKQPVTGSQIVEAVKRLVDELKLDYNYKEKLIREYDLDGDLVRTVQVGLSSGYPDKHVVIRTGERLENKEIQSNQTYEIVGVGSVDWGGIQFAINFYEIDVVESVEEVRDGLEKLL